MTTFKRHLSLIFITLVLTAAVVPLAVHATATASFTDPLGGARLIDIVQRAIKWLLGLVGLIALLGLVVGGTRLIIGGLGNESEVAEGKRIIYWAIIGLVVVGMAAAILAVVGYVLGLRAGTLPGF